MDESLALPNPLLAMHEAAGAQVQPYADTPVVSTFGQPELEYAAIRKGCGLMDLPQRGVLEVTGPDRLEFLNNLLSNQTFDKQAKGGMAGGTGVYAFLLSNKGRIIVDLNVLELGDRTLLEMDGRYVGSTLKALDKYLFSEKVKMAGRLGAMHQMALHGPRSREVLEAALGEPVGELPALGSRQVRLMGQDVIVWRDDPAGVPGYHLIVPDEAAETVWSALLQTGGDDAHPLVRAVGWAACNATRIEAGRPIFAIDFDDSILPAETGQLDRAVSFTKGCYVGQEIVARMHSREQLAKQLVGLRVEGDALPIAGAKVYDAEQNEIGGITSSTMSPVLSNTPICFGYVRRAFLHPGTKVRVPAEGAMREAVVRELPFVK